MTSNLLLTKLYRPAVPLKHVQRPFLVDRLNEGLAAGRQLTLVSAPAGFGKTVCVSEWINSVDLPVAWLALDTADDDPLRFFTYLLAALQGVNETLGQEIQGTLRAGHLPPDEVMSAALINDILALDRRLILILDDFQVIQDEAILRVLQTLVSNIPPALHLVLVTREEPSLPLARLRANNQMTELRAADLRFACHETADFLNKTMGLSLKTADIAALEEKTEGWIAGLQLAGLSLRDRGDPSAFVTELSGSHRHILSYLTEEVLNRQPADVQRFLLQTSILDKLSGDLCDRLTGDHGSRALLEQLFNDNLFLVPLDDEQQWYRYHQLFADLLRDRLNVVDPEAAAELHRQASRWYVDEGMSGEAIQHAIAGEDYETAIDLIEAHYMDRLMAWHARTVKGWMLSIPAELAAKSPKTNLAFAWMYLMSNDFTQALPYIERLRVMFSGSDLDEEDPSITPDLAISPDLSIRAEWLAMQAMLLNAQGRPDDSLALADVALAIVPEEDAYVRSLIYGGLATSYIQKNDGPQVVEAYKQLIQYGRMAGSLLSELMGIAGLGLFLLDHGQLQLAFDLAMEGIESVERSGTLPPISGAIYGELGSIYYDRHQLEEAQAHLTRSAQVSKLSGYSDAEIFYHVILSRLALMKGDIETAVAEMNKAMDLTEIEAPAAVREEVIGQRVRVALAQDLPDEAEALLKPHGFVFHPDRSAELATCLVLPEFVPGQTLNRQAAILYNSALRILLYQAKQEGRPVDLGHGIHLVDRLLTEAQESSLIPVMIETLLIRAQMHGELGDELAARKDVVATLELGEPEGFVTIFLEAGQSVSELLLRLLGSGQLEGAQSEHAQKIADAFAESVRSVEKIVPETDADPVGADLLGQEGPQETLVEPLSKRELEILGLIGDGCTNQEIAEKLVISLHTVKKHSSNIYSKLGVRSRTQAVARARELHLL